MVDKEKMAIARLQDAARLSEHRYKMPLMVTYSGGKDSQVLVALAERAGINFEVVNSHTTADAPETVYFIRKQFYEMEQRGIKCSIVMPRYKDKPVSMWTLIPQKLMPPTRMVRYCCDILKENTGRNRFIATGVRWAESTRRKNNRGIMELMNRDKEKRIILMGDNDEKRQLFETCNLKGKMTVNPIVDWLDSDVWDYTHSEDDVFVPCLVNVITWDLSCTPFYPDESYGEYVSPAMYNTEQKTFSVGWDSCVTTMNALLDPEDTDGRSGSRVTHWMELPATFGFWEEPR